MTKMLEEYDVDMVNGDVLPGLEWLVGYVCSWNDWWVTSVVRTREDPALAMI